MTEVLRDDQKAKIIAEFSGFKPTLPDDDSGNVSGVDGWSVPGGMYTAILPDFPHSLEDQKKWAWPKFQEKGIEINIVLHEGGGVSITLTDVQHSEVAPVYLQGEDVAETFAEAAVKMIQKRKAWNL